MKHRTSFHHRAQGRETSEAWDLCRIEDMGHPWLLGYSRGGGSIDNQKSKTLGHQGTGDRDVGPVLMGKDSDKQERHLPLTVVQQSGTRTLEEGKDPSSPRSPRDFWLCVGHQLDLGGPRTGPHVTQLPYPHPKWGVSSAKAELRPRKLTAH